MNGKILIVDDEAPIRRMVSRLVAGMGHTSTEAENGQDGLAKAEAVQPDLVITDMKMPVMDGLKMARALIEQDPARPVLLMTAYADLDSAREALKIGIYEYFQKPFDMSDVMAGVNRALERRRLVLENQAYQADLELKVRERTAALRVKVRELEARDSLLRHMLSIQSPEETLALATELSLTLCGADSAILHVPGAEDAFVPSACAGMTMESGSLEDMAPAHDDGIRRGFEELLETHRVVRAAFGGARSQLGLAQVVLYPVLKGAAVAAVLEVGRRAEAPVALEVDASLDGFLPYVAMAVADCALNDSLSDLDGSLDAMMNAAELGGALDR